jgi:ABC-type oligopeptide transport system ATPase subunit
MSSLLTAIDLKSTSPSALNGRRAGAQGRDGVSLAIEKGETFGLVGVRLRQDHAGPHDDRLYT